MKKLLIFSLLAGFATLGLSAQGKKSHNNIQIIESKTQLNLPNFRPNQGAGFFLRNSILCGYSYNWRKTELNAHQFRVLVKHTLFVDADHGGIIIKGSRPEDVAYFVDGVRIRTSKVNL